uniref:Uncharacterized protein n=1 Tax=Rhizophora mucronata TaxID=61149 RepID=A0A2P2IN52_RHIMU
MIVNQKIIPHPG